MRVSSLLTWVRRSICGLMLLSWGASVAVAVQDDGGAESSGAQALGANAVRLIEAMDYLGRSFPEATRASLLEAVEKQDALGIQKILDPLCLVEVSINPEVRVKVARGEGAAGIDQAGFVPFLIRVENQATVTRTLQIDSPQAGRVYAGAAINILQRQAQTELLDGADPQSGEDRFLEVEVFRGPPMTERLSGLELEYVVGLVYSSQAGKREALLRFDVGQGTEDLGFRAQVPVLFDVAPAVPVTFKIRDVDGKPTTSRLEIRDGAGHVYPAQAKRLAPDFFFQPQIYRADGEQILLPAGKYEVISSRGPEYLRQRQVIEVASGSVGETIEIQLVRWIDPLQRGWVSGDHHIHGAGCSHYESPTQGVLPSDMFRQVKGEGLNVGCVLTWGPCFDYQRQFFSPQADDISERETLLKYDLEISGFGSAALGHVCLLNLTDQTYPGSEGTKIKGWPTWTVPVLRWAKEQGGVTGYPHSAMPVDPNSEARRFIEGCDGDGDGELTELELAGRLLPVAFAEIDGNRNGTLSEDELRLSLRRAAERLPNLAVPAMNGGGAMEIFVSASEGVCDFISAMDTARIPEWNTWYHLLNCGLPVKVSGETDFPCMSSRRVGQGRVYVQMAEPLPVDFGAWCEGIEAGRAYVSDGFAHALEFSVEGRTPGSEAVELERAGTVVIEAVVCFAPETPRTVAQGLVTPGSGRSWLGDTVNLHARRSDEWVQGGVRTVEIVSGGEVVASREVPADGKEHRLEFEIEVEQSTWVALRQFPMLHTNPVDVQVAGKPIRCSRESALWCAECVERVWENRHRFIAPEEREAARAAYDRAVARYRRIAEEAGVEE